MNEIGMFILTCSVIAISVIFTVLRNKSVNDLFSQMGTKLGLSFTKGGLFNGPILSGKYEGFYLNVSHFYSTKNSPAKNFYSLKFPTPSGNHFTIRPEGLFSKLGQVGGHKDIQVCDDSFDNAVFLESSDEANLISLLDEQTRQWILSLANSACSKAFEINSREIQYSATEENLDYKIKNLIKLAQGLMEEKSIEERLELNFMNDSIEAVRLNNFKYLIHRLTDREERKEILRRGLNDHNPEINFISYKFSGNHADSSCLEGVWKNGTPDLKMRLIHYLGQRPGAENLKILLAHYPPGNIELKEAMLKAFGHHGRDEVNDRLVKELSSENNKIVSAAIEALGPCGKLSAVEPLMKIKNPLLKRGAKQAIGMIQSRLADGEGGWLSVSENGEEGALSLEKENGLLSIDSSREE